MNAHELEEEFWRRSTECFRHPHGNWLVDGYAPPGGGVADFTIIRHRDRFHLFHIERRAGGDCAWPGHEIYFGHASTADFLTWECHDPVLLIQPGTWEGNHVYAPFVFEEDDRFVMFYTGLNGANAQQIGMAFSSDLFTWERYADNPVICPENYPWAWWKSTEVSSCRDPHVLRIGDRCHLYYTAVTREGDGCVALATSPDLCQWDDQGPVNTIVETEAILGKDSNHLESACVHAVDGRYLLCYNFMGGVRANWSDSPYDFGHHAGAMIWEGVHSFEVVVRHDLHWLVAGFSGKTERLVLGAIDWRAEHPGVQRITTPEHLAPFLTV